MITLITGVPGSGKTLYCVAELLPQIIGTSVPSDAGDVPRTVYTNIKGLLLDHQLIDKGPDGLGGWHTWCKPGDYIVYDEVQEVWKPRPNGSKVPDDIGSLETHRHMGVDFVLLTQHPMLLDQNVRALIGRHLHIRRMGGMGAAIVYEWDSCSRSLTYSNSITRKPWRYKKSAFANYRSAELHTKQNKSLPLLLWIVLVVLVASLYFVPSTYQRLFKKDGTPDSPGTTTPGKAPSPTGDTGAARPNVRSTPTPPVRADPDTDNQTAARVQIDDLSLVGYLKSGNIQHALVSWLPNGVYRATFDLLSLPNAGITYQIYGNCHLQVIDQTGAHSGFVLHSICAVPHISVDTTTW